MTPSPSFLISINDSKFEVFCECLYREARRMLLWMALLGMEQVVVHYFLSHHSFTVHSILTLLVIFSLRQKMLRMFSGVALRLPTTPLSSLSNSPCPLLRSSFDSSLPHQQKSLAHSPRLPNQNCGCTSCLELAHSTAGPLLIHQPASNGM